MTAPSLTWSQIEALNPCVNSLRLVRKKIKAAFPDYLTRSLTLADAASAGVGFDELIWITNRADKIRARLFAADCAARVAHLANDERSNEAIRCSRLFARGQISAEDFNAAAQAAATAFASMEWTPAVAPTWAGRVVAAWAAAWGDATPRATARLSANWTIPDQWQKQRLLEWFSDEEPEDWPLPAVQEVELAA